MKLKLFLLSVLIYSNIFADNHILVSTNPSSESSTLIPNSQNTFDSNKIFSSLDQANTYITNTYGRTISENVTVYIRKGHYSQNNINWVSTSPIYTMKITSYNGEKVVMDGNGLRPNGGISNMFLELDAKYQRTNFWIQGLIIQNYVNGIQLGKSIISPTTVQNSHNVIKNNIFRNIGDKFTPNNAYAQYTYIGYFALGLNFSTNNLIELNVFYRNENDKTHPEEGPTKNKIHSVYIANYSSENIIKDNYASLCSGGAFRIRNASNDNVFDNNYIDQSGKNGFISEWYRTPKEFPDRFEKISTGTFIKGNTCTFPYLGYGDGIKLFSSKVDDNNYISGGDNFVIGSKPIGEKIGAVASGDINADGIDENFVAFNYGNFTKLVRSRPETPLYLSEVLYVSKHWHVSAMEMSDFDNNGVPELITAFNELSNNDKSTQVFKGDGVNSISNQGLLYHSTWWKTASITSGDYDGNGTIEIYTAFNAPDDSGIDKTQIWKGTGRGNKPLLNLGKQSNHDWWLTGTMTSGDYDADGKDEVFVAYNAPNDSGVYNTQVFKGTGDGINPLKNLGEKYNHDWWLTGTMTSGDYDADGKDEVFIAYTAPNDSGMYNSQVFKGTGEGNDPLKNLGEKYNHSWWRIGNMISGNFIKNSMIKDEISMFYSGDSATQMAYGDGEYSLSNYGQHYRSEEVITYTFTPFYKNSILNADSPILRHSDISIYPNPISSSNSLKISGASENFEILIYSNTGKLIKTVKDRNEIDLENLFPGLYYIKITNFNNTIMKKLIVK